MGVLLRVQVPPQAGHSERSEAQPRKGDRPWGGSVDRNRGPMNKNWIRSAADQGERAMNREALVTKGWWRKSNGRAATENVLTWGDLASHLKRVTVSSRSEKSAEAVVATGFPGAKGRTRERGVPSPMREARYHRPRTTGGTEPARDRGQPLRCLAFPRPCWSQL
jgi:hypothetical protein